jgi:hypothetical protein
MLQIILDFMQKLPGCMQRIVKQNEEQLFISTTANAAGKARSRSSAVQVAQEGDHISKLYSYPSSVTGKKKDTQMA